MLECQTHSQRRRSPDMNSPFTLIWPIFSARNTGSGSSLDKPLSSCTSSASIVSSRYIRHALSSADKCSILSSLCTQSRRLWERITDVKLFPYLCPPFNPKHGHERQDRSDRSNLWRVRTAAKEMTNYTDPVLFWAIFHSILACQRELSQVAAGACEQLEIPSGRLLRNSQ